MLASSYGVVRPFHLMYIYQDILDPHILVKVDILSSKSVNELLVVRWKPSEGNREEEEKDFHGRVSKNVREKNFKKKLYERRRKRN